MGHVEKKCLFCDKTFLETSSRIKEGRGKYCSPEHYWQAKKGKPSSKRNKIQVNCYTCGKPILKVPSQVWKKNFCSNDCRFKGYHGHHLSEEHKEKLSKAQRGKDRPWLHTPEAIRKMSQSKKGTPSWNKDRSWTPEEKQTLSKAHRKGLDGLILANIIANKRLGTCISTIYINTHKLLRWQCQNKHEWENTLSHIQNGQWCPECSGYISERYCRAWFESIFSEKFPRKKPKWLINSRGNLMELDGYNEKLRLAFEYQGEQHYKEHHFFHKRSSLEQRILDDVLKKELCKRHEIILIEVPYTANKDMFAHILVECSKKGLHPSSDWIDPKQFNIYSRKSTKTN